MAKRSYGQYCGLARAADLVGERWALLIVRDLLVSPRRFTDLRRGLPKIPTNVLTTRLKELEEAGVVHRRVLPRPDGSVVYELTDHGRELEEIVLALGRWGARTLGEPAPDEIVTVDSMVMAMRSTFRPDAARGVRAGFELRLGDIVLHLRVNDGTLAVTPGDGPAADLVIETGPAIRALLAHKITPTEALADGTVRVAGKTALLDRFVAMFRI